MSIKLNRSTVTHQGFTHTRHCFYRSELNIPSGFVLVVKGSAQLNDMVMVHVPPFPKPESYKRYLGKEAIIKAKWETVKSVNIGINVSRFKAVIRPEDLRIQLAPQVEYPK